MTEKKLPTFQLFFLSTITLVFFAANSLLCKVALQDSLIDENSFTFLRLFSGALVLVFLLFLKERTISLEFRSNWKSAFMLFLYAICFSYAYLSLDAGLGALILFATVQLTMIIVAITRKEKLTFKKATGMSLAFLGLFYLLFPKEDFSLSIEHFLLMVLSGIAWAFYTILGKSSQNALKNSADNFIKTIPFLIIFSIVFSSQVEITTYGAILAIISGGITSALGYALWYVVLKNIQLLTASIIQLLVPVIAIFLSVLLLGEVLTSTLVVSTILILSGIFISIYKN